MKTTALVGIFAFAITANAQVTTTLARRTISTTGTATVAATPDKANAMMAAGIIYGQRASHAA